MSARRVFARVMLASLAAIVFVIALTIGGAPGASAQPVPTPLPLYALPDARTNRAFTSGSMALGGDGVLMAAANSLNNTVTLFVPTQNRVIAEIPVGSDPRGVAFSPNGERLIVTLRGDGALGVINPRDAELTGTIRLDGVWPYGVVIGADNRTAYVSLWGSAEIAVVDLQTEQVTARIPVGAAPAGLALWGDFVYVTHFWSGAVSLIYLPAARVVAQTAVGGAGALQAIEPDITRGIAYLPLTRANVLNAAPTYDSWAAPAVEVIDLRNLAPVREERIALATADRPVNMPFAAALDRFAERLYIANAGSNDVSVIDLDSGRARAHIPVGANPRGILLNRDNTRLFVHNMLDGTVTTVDTNTLETIDVLPISQFTVSVDLLIGAQWFHSAADPRLSRDGWLSCATCHFDGTSDGRVWAGVPDGARNTPLLYALPETVPYNWSQTYDELADVEVKIHEWMGGTGLIDDTEDADSLLGRDPAAMHSSASLDLDLLVAYLTSIPVPPPSRIGDNEAVARGEAVFAAQACAECHVGEAGTNLRAFDVGTGGSPLERRGEAFDTPTLRWLVYSAPYFHDGRAPTLRSVFELPGTHQLVTRAQPNEIDDLVAYLLSRPR